MKFKLTTPLLLSIVALFAPSLKHGQQVTSVSHSEIGTSVGTSVGQESINPDAGRRDIDELAERLVQLHPRCFDYIAQREFDDLVAIMKASITNKTSKAEFLWMFSRVVACIKCGHTRMEYFNQEDKLISVGQRFPVDVRLVQGKLYVVDPLANQDKVSSGSEFVEINGRSTSELIHEIYQHISSDAGNPHFRQGLFNTSATAYLTYVLGFPEHYEVRIAGNAKPVRLNALTSFKYKPIHWPMESCKGGLCFRIERDGRTAVMTIRSWAFYGNQATVFRQYVDQSIQQMKKAKVTNLIIDVRGNMGGSGLVANYLLQHLASKPFQYFGSDSVGAESLKKGQSPAANRFQGNVCILSNGSTGSATGHFLSLFKYHQMGTIIGGVSGSSYTVNDNSKRFRSSQLGVTYYIARNTFSTDVKGQRADQGVHPDRQISPTIKDILSGTDPVLELAREQFSTK